MTAVEQICSAIESGVRCVIVKGAAGTGKTTLICSILPFLAQARYDVKLLAPTGRAAKMIQTRTGHAASTIHSQIYKVDERPDESKDEEYQDFHWVFPLRSDRPARTAFIVDEASMVGAALHNDGILRFGSGSLLHDLVEYAGISRQESDNLIVFVGDPFQLPPIGERAGDPPALNKETIESIVGSEVDVVELSHVYRQSAESGILKEAVKLRSAIACNLFTTLRYEQHQDVRIVDEGLLPTLYHPEANLNSKIIIAYTNARVWEFNCAVRRMLKIQSPLPQAGEHLMCLRNTVVSVGEDREDSFMNGDILLVVSSDTVHLVSIEGFYNPGSGRERKKFVFTFCRMSLSWIGDTTHTDDAETWVNITPIVSQEYRDDPEYASVALYVAVSERIRSRYPETKKDRALFREKLKKSKFYHAPIVTYGYAITGHKAQGGEWNEVWVDYSSTRNKMSEDYFRWAYTATTRARKMLFALAPPAFDDITEALERGIARLDASAEQTPVTKPMLPLEAMLARHGYLIGSVTKRPFAVRLQLVKQNDPLSDAGSLDINFNGKGIVSYVRMACADASDELGSDVAGLRGRNMRGVLPEAGQEKIKKEVSIEIDRNHERIRDRLSVAAEKVGLQILAMKSVTQHQMRIELSSSLGEGYVDFYVDGKGRVTEMGSMTVPAAALTKLKEGLAG